jgi:hypothetical protein
MFSTCARCGKQLTSAVHNGIPTCERCLRDVKAKQEKIRVCIDDGTSMNKIVVGNVIIDKCPTCSGIWFDKGELEALQRAKESRSWWWGFFWGTVT